MPTQYFRATIVAALLTANAACEPDAITDVTEQRTDPRGDLANPLPFQAATDSTDILAALETPTGSTIRFIELRDGARAGVLIVEEGEEGTLVMDRIIAAAGGDLRAADLYASLVEPGASRADIPSPLRDLVTTSYDARPAGWAREMLASSPPAALASSSQIACNNANFTSQIPGGFRAKNFKRLDTGPSFHPGLWAPYDFDGSTHYYYQTWANGTPRWGGKVCGKAGFHPQVQGWLTTVPVLQFLYRPAQSWKLADKRRTFAGNNRVFGWRYDGELGAIDWKIHIYDAYIFDEFDVMMSWN